MNDSVRDRLSDSISHLYGVTRANTHFIERINAEIAEIDRLAVGHQDPRVAMTQDMKEGLLALKSGTEKVTTLIQQKLCVCESLLRRANDAVCVCESEKEIAAKMMCDCRMPDTQWVALVVEMVAQGDSASVLGVVLPHLRESDVPAFRALCE